MSRRARLPALAAMAVLLCMSGCGGDSSDGQPASTRAAVTASLSPAVIAHANATCRYLRRETEELGKGVLSGSSNLAEMTTERLVKPAIPLLERVSRRQQALANTANSTEFSLYARLFDPIIVLARQRLHTGRESERPGQAQYTLRSQKLEKLMTSLGLEQMQVARNVGLADCGVDFEHVLMTSLTG